MGGFSGRMETCPHCGKEVAVELMGYHLWGCHAKPQSERMKNVPQGVYGKDVEESA